MEQVNKQTFIQKLKSYKRNPGSLILLALVVISALITIFVTVSLVGYILIKGIPNPELS